MGSPRTVVADGLNMAVLGSSTPQHTVSTLLKPNIASTAKDLAGTATGTVTSTLVVVKPQRKMTAFERMGTEIITVEVGRGSDKVQFQVHKKLIVTASRTFDSHFKQCPKATIYLLPNTTPDVFKLILNYLYDEDVPGLDEQANATDDQIATRVRELCQLYALAEGQGMSYEFLNKLMDEIQDGFARIDRLPETGFITNVYNNTLKTSKLRLFCAYSLLFDLQRPEYQNKSNLPDILTENPALMLDFLACVRNSTRPGVDTRLRNCGRSALCSSCHFGMDHLKDGKTGVFSCWFHVHPDFDHYKQNEDGMWVENRIADDCYLNINVVNVKLQL